MILATHGIVGSQIVQVVYDADAQAFFDRVTTAGGSLSLTEKSAVNQLVLDMKDDGIWESMKAIYPIVGASAASCAQNLKSSSFTGTFTSGWTFSSNGMNGSSGTFFNTDLIPNNHILVDSTHISIYINNNLSGNYCEIGTESTNTKLVLLQSFSGNDISRINCDTFPGFVTQPDNDGFFIGSRIASTEFKIYRNTTTIRTTVINSTSLPTEPVYIGQFNSPGPRYASPRRYAFASIGEGLTDDEASDFYDAVQAFNTTLSRQV
jgi:hypothetical protein